MDSDSSRPTRLMFLRSARIGLLLWAAFILTSCDSMRTAGIRADPNQDIEWPPQLSPCISPSEKPEYLRIGHRELAFDAHDELIGLVFDFRAPTEKQIDAFLDYFKNKFSTDELSINRVRKEDATADFTHNLGYGYFLKISDPLQQQKVIAILRYELLASGLLKKGATFRVGTPIKVSNRWATILDRFFILRFSPNIDLSDSDKWLTCHGAKPLKSLTVNERLLLIEFESDDYRTNLSIVESGFRDGYLEIGEPDVLFRLVLQAWPNDSRYAEQIGTFESPHQIQKIRQAWDLLYAAQGSAPPRLPGSYKVFIGIIDGHIDAYHPEIDCPAGDGSEQLFAWINAEDILDCKEIPGNCPAPVGGHGMAVASVILACTNNRGWSSDGEIAGIAPGARLIVGSFMDNNVLSASRYSDLLMWMAGAGNLCPVREICPKLPKQCSKWNWEWKSWRWFWREWKWGWPRRSDCINAPVPGASVINNSYTSTLIEGTLETIDLTLASLAAGSLTGRPVALIYAAGNGVGFLSPGDDTDDHFFAGHHSTMAIANCTASPKHGDYGSIPEIRLSGDDCWDRASYWGPKIDVCAIGHNSPTVDTWCPVGSIPRANTACYAPPGTPTTCPAVLTNCSFGGTSAAAATVTGVVALLLTANSLLGPEEIRSILRKTAIRDKITFASICVPATTFADAGWVSGRSDIYGSGLVNACEAVKAALVKGGTAIPNRADGSDYCK